MTVRQLVPGSGTTHAAPIDGGPVAEVLLGPPDGEAFGALEVRIPVGGGMPDHAHGDSAVLLIVKEGRLALREAADGTGRDLVSGDLVLIPRDEVVSLANAGDREARALVVLTPADFAGQVAAWPPA